MNAQPLSSTVANAIRAGDIPPDILGHATGLSERLDKDGVEWVASLRPAVVGPGSDASILIMLQNAMDVPSKVSVSLEVTKHPNILSSKIELRDPKPVQLQPLEVATLDIPIRIRENAGEGDYTVKLSLNVKFSGSPTRVRPKAQQLKTQRNWGSLIAKNVLGVGLGATVGLGFVSIPRTYVGVTFRVAKLGGVAVRKQSMDPELTSIWTSADWERSIQTKEAVLEELGRLPGKSVL